MSSIREQAATERGRLPVARRDKRPALAALAILLILVGALGSALLVFRSGDRESVLAAREAIVFGQTITKADFKTVRAAADPSSVVDAQFVDNFVGTRAISNIPAGSLVNKDMFSKDPSVMVPQGGENVGIVIDATQRPSTMPRPGAVVRLYHVAGSSTTKSTTDQTVIVPAARVVAVGRGSGAGTRSITVLVRSSAAAQVANFASSGNVAVSVLPGDTKPAIDIAR